MPMAAGDVALTSFTIANNSALTAEQSTSGVTFNTYANQTNQVTVRGTYKIVNAATDALVSVTLKNLDKAYSPMSVRFFILQAHYRSTVDFSNEALQASEKGLQRLMTGIQTLDKLPASKES